MSISNAKVEMQIGPASAWVDVTCDVASLSTDRGKEAQHLPFEPGRADITIKDADGRFHPMNPGSPYRDGGVTLLRAGAAVRIEVQPGGVGAWVRIFTGVVRVWPVGVVGSGTYPTVRTIECTDRLGVLAESDVPTIVLGAAQEPTDARVERWLTAGGVTGADRDIVIPATLTHEIVDIRGKVFAGIRATVASTMDDVWCGRDGVVRGREATCLLTPPAASITFSNLVASTTPPVDVELVTSPTVRKVLRRREIGYSDPLGQTFSGVLVASATLPATGAPAFGGEQTEEGPCDLIATNAYLDEIKESARRRALSQPFDGFAVRSVSMSPDWHADIRTWLLAQDPIRRWVAVEHRSGTGGSAWTMTRTGWVRSERHEWTPGQGENSWRVVVGIDDNTGTAPVPVLAFEVEGPPWVINATEWQDIPTTAKTLGEVVQHFGFIEPGAIASLARDAYAAGDVAAESQLVAGAGSASADVAWDDSVAGTGGYSEIQALAEKGYITSGGYSGTDFADTTVTADASASFQSDIRVTWEQGASNGSVLLGSKAGGGGHIPHITMPGTLVVEGGTTPAGAGKLGVFNVAAAPVVQQAIPTTATELAEKMQAYGLLAAGTIGDLGIGDGGWNDSWVEGGATITAADYYTPGSPGDGNATSERYTSHSGVGSVAMIASAKSNGLTAGARNGAALLHVSAIDVPSGETGLTLVNAEAGYQSSTGAWVYLQVMHDSTSVMYAGCEAAGPRWGVFGSEAGQQATPATLADVIAILQAFGLAA